MTPYLFGEMLMNIFCSHLSDERCHALHLPFQVIADGVVYRLRQTVHQRFRVAFRRFGNLLRGAFRRQLDYILNLQNIFNKFLCQCFLTTAPGLQVLQEFKLGFSLSGWAGACSLKIDQSIERW